nr:hypothetical protein [Mycolicibacterium sp. BK634]
MAAALGIGAAVWLGQGVAWADDESQGASSAGPASHAPRGAATQHSTTRTKPTRTEQAKRTTTPVSTARSARTTPTTVSSRVSVPKVALRVPHAPVTVKSVVNDVLTWVGLGALTPRVPLPNLPVPEPIASFWLAVREFEKSINVGLVRTNRSEAIGYLYNQPLMTADGTRVVMISEPPSSDGAYKTRVVVVDTATGLRVGYADLPGNPAGLVLSADGRRAVVTSAENLSVHVTVFNTATGNQIGSTVTVSGALARPPVLSADGSRALIAMQSGNESGDTVELTAIDTKTGTQSGSTLVLSGLTANTLLTADGSRAVIAAVGLYPGTHVAVMDTATGLQLGDTVSLASGLTKATLSADGSRALVIAGSYVGGEPGYAYEAAVVDTATGAQVGDTMTSTVPLADGILNNNGTRVTFTMPALAGLTSHTIATFDPETGEQVGPTLNLSADRSSTVPIGTTSRVLISSGGYDVAQDQYMSWVRVVDSTTGNQIGDAVPVAGRISQTLLSADGKRAVLTTEGSTTMVIDTATGAQVGDALTLTGERMDTVLSGDGRRALVLSRTWHSIPGYTYRVAVINTVTGAQLGETLSFTGDTSLVASLSADGSRALIALGTDTGYSRVEVLNTRTGAHTGVKVPYNAGGWSPLISADGTRAFVAGNSYYPFVDTYRIF